MKNSEANTEMLYIFGAMLLIGAKAVGLEERSLLFALLFIFATILIAIKMLFDEYTFSEIILFAALIGYGVYAYFNMGSIGLLSMMILLVGMKGIEVKFLFKWLAFEYVICFLCTVLLSFLSNRDGVVLVHEKLGQIILRQSLGYTHPNVLHITYVILMVLVLIASNRHGKELINLSLVLLIGDAVVFLFSLSTTGMITSLLLLCGVIYVEFRKIKSFGRAEKIILNLWIPLAFFGFFVASWISTWDPILEDKMNKIFNMRLWCVGMYYELAGLSLFGKRLTLPGIALDNSYGYALFAYGIVFLLISFCAYLFTIRYLIRNNRILDTVIFVVLMFGGISEQFMFNASLKNLTLFFIGEWLFKSKLSCGQRFYQGLKLPSKKLKICRINKYDSERTLKCEKNSNSIWLYLGMVMGGLFLVAAIAMLYNNRNIHQVIIPTTSADINATEVRLSDISSDGSENDTLFIGGEKNEYVYVLDDSNSLIIKQIRFNIYVVIIMCIGSVAFAGTKILKRRDVQ